MQRPGDALAGPRYLPVMNDSPIPNLEDVCIAEMEISRLYLLAQLSKNGHNSFPELVLHERLRSVYCRCLLWSPTCYGAIPFSRWRKKLASEGSERGALAPAYP